MTKKSPPPVDFNLNQHIENLPRAISSGKRKDNFFFSTERTGRSFTMKSLDPMGYDAESSDLLYKHWPFYITRSAEKSGAFRGRNRIAPDRSVTKNAAGISRTKCRLFYWLHRKFRHSRFFFAENSRGGPSPLQD